MSDPENVSANRTTTDGPDPHGNAALLLIESLIHGLCEKSLLKTGEAIEIVERAVEVQAENLEASDGAKSSQKSHTLLSSIASSLRRDDFDDPATPILVQ